MTHLFVNQRYRKVHLFLRKGKNFQNIYTGFFELGQDTSEDMPSGAKQNNFLVHETIRKNDSGWESINGYMLNASILLQNITDS